MKDLTINLQSQRLQSVASKDNSRPNITGVNYTERAAIATDGHCLVAVKKTPEEPSCGIFKFSSAKQKTVKGWGESNYSQIGDSPIYASAHQQNAEKIDAEFPNCRILIDGARQPQMTITIRADLIAKIAAGLGENFLTLNIFDDRSPIFVGCGDDTKAAILMPAKALKGGSDALGTLRNLL